MDKFTCFLASLFLIPLVLSSCPPGYSNYTNNNKCYKVFTTQHNWYDAEQTCFNEGGHLASVDSAYTNLLLGNLVKNMSSSATDFWLGGYYNWYESKWLWTDFSNFSTTYWKAGQPNITYDMQYCAMQSLQENYKWISGDCRVDFKPFVCEVSIDESNSPCPDGWIFNKFLNKCYKYVKGNNQTCDIWSIEKYCQKIGGHAISIHSLGENLYVSSIYFSYYNNQTDPYKWHWIGLIANSSDYTNSSNFHWIDGTPLDFTNWNSLGPENPCANIVDYSMDTRLILYQWRTGICDISAMCEDGLIPPSFVCAIKL